MSLSPLVNRDQFIAKKIKLLTLVLITLLTSCQNRSNPSRNTILQKLENTKGHGILFGHQDDLAYGVEWQYIDGASDVKSIAGDYPALFGWELGGLEIGNNVNLDSVPFSTMSQLTIKAHNMGAINTFSWHPYNVINGKNAWNTDTLVVKHLLEKGNHQDAFLKQLDLLADFFKTLKTEDGTDIPFIFRPWHEMDGSWFWWGSNRCTAQELQSLFAFTIHYLREEKHIHQMLVAYSPDCNFNTMEEYLTWYPGDDLVDILGVDNYYDLKTKDGIQSAKHKLHIVIEAAKQKGKLAALTESGLENMTDSLWFTENLGEVLQDSVIKSQLSYLMLWRNDSKKHFFFSYPGHSSSQNAKNFLLQTNILLLEEFKLLSK